MGCVSRSASHSIERLLLTLALLLELELGLGLEIFLRLPLDRHRLVHFPVVLTLFSRLRPGRLAKKYWHVIPRHSHFEHDGFSLGHLTLDTAQAWQLSRSFDRDNTCLRVRSTWLSDPKSNIVLRWMAPSAVPNIVIQTAHRRHCAVSYHERCKVLTKYCLNQGGRLYYELN